MNRFSTLLRTQGRMLTPLTRQGVRSFQQPRARTLELAGVRNGSTKGSADPLYSLFFKRNFMYVTYIFIGAVAVEFAYGKVADSLWESHNQGKLYKHIDWSKFQEEEEEEEEDEEEEAEEAAGEGASGGDDEDDEDEDED